MRDLDIEVKARAVELALSGTQEEVVRAHLEDILTIKFWGVRESDLAKVNPTAIMKEVQHDLDFRGLAGIATVRRVIHERVDVYRIRVEVDVFSAGQWGEPVTTKVYCEVRAR